MGDAPAEGSNATGNDPAGILEACAAAARSVLAWTHAAAAQTGMSSAPTTSGRPASTSVPSSAATRRRIEPSAST